MFELNFETVSDEIKLGIEQSDAFQFNVEGQTINQAVVLNKAEVDDNGDLILTLSDGRVMNVGHVVGPKGQDAEVGFGLKVVDGKVTVDTENDVVAESMKPITSAAVYTEVGNIAALLGTI